MIQTIFNIIFLPFSFTPVLYCCGFALVVGVFGLVSSLMGR